MSWDTMLTDEQRRPELVRRRDLSRMSKVQLIDRLIAAEHRLAAEREVCPQPCEHLSQHDAREGKTCPEDPCTCTDRENGSED